MGITLSDPSQEMSLTSFTLQTQRDMGRVGMGQNDASKLMMESSSTLICQQLDWREVQSSSRCRLCESGRYDSLGHVYNQNEQYDLLLVHFL